MKKILSITIIASLIIALSACGTDKNREDAETALQKTSLLQTVSAEEFSNAMRDNADHLLLDVRTQEEYDTSHLIDSTLIAVQELSSRVHEIVEWKDKPVFVYCRTGNRSLTASKILRDAGFTNIYNLEGGITSWIQNGFAVE